MILIVTLCDKPAPSLSRPGRCICYRKDPSVNSVISANFTGPPVWITFVYNCNDISFPQLKFFIVLWCVVKIGSHLLLERNKDIGLEIILCISKMKLVPPSTGSIFSIMSVPVIKLKPILLLHVVSSQLQGTSTKHEKVHVA